MKNLIRNNSTAIIWLCLAHLFCDIYGGFLNPLMPFIASKLGFSMGVATILIAITQICSNMLQPIFGFFADNNLKRFFIFWGIILASVFIPFAPSAPNIVILNIFMILGCLGGSFFHPQSMGFINFFSGVNCSKAMGIFISLGSLGFALGPLLATFIAQNYGLEKIAFTSAFGLVLALLMFFFVPKLSLTTKLEKRNDFIDSFKEILKNTQIKLLMLIAMMKSLVTNSSCILLPFLWKSLDYTPSYIGFALFLFVFAGSIGSFLSPFAEKIFGSKPVIYLSMWLSLPLMFTFSTIYESRPTLSLVIFAIIGFTTMLAQPVTLVWAQRTLPQYKSITAGLINGFCWGTVALCLSFLGIIAEKYGIMNILVILTILPIISSYFVKYLKE